VPRLLAPMGARVGVVDRRGKMRYENKSDLPPTIRDVLPEHAQELYLQAYQKAWDEYEKGHGYLSRDGSAHQRGWTAVQHEYVQDQGTGEWHRMGEEPAKGKAQKGLVGRLQALFSGRS
jgi:cation transport regulator